jgi:hypothetical protein
MPHTHNLVSPDSTLQAPASTCPTPCPPPLSVLLW